MNIFNVYQRFKGFFSLDNMPEKNLFKHYRILIIANLRKLYYNYLYYIIKKFLIFKGFDVKITQYRNKCICLVDTFTTFMKFVI